MRNVLCANCGITFSVVSSRALTAKYCSTACRDIGAKAAPNQTCDSCGSGFYMKQSQIDRYARNLGVFCSHGCTAKAKSIAYLGSKNPNHKGRNIDQDGYRLYSPQSSLLLGNKRMKLHTAVCCEVLGIPAIPKDYHVHHRDCDVLNNTASNLSVLSASDHKWLHKQFGVATLWAYCEDKIPLCTLLQWTDDMPRASRLLPLTVLGQVGQQFN